MQIKTSLIDVVKLRSGEIYSLMVAFYLNLIRGVYVQLKFSGADVLPRWTGSEDHFSANWERVVMTMFSRFMKDESGATAIEYGLIAALIGVGIIVVLQNVRGELQNTFTKVQTELKNATN